MISGDSRTTDRRRPGGSPGAGRTALAAILTAAAVLCTGPVTAAATAERVVFQDGRSLRVAGHRAVGDRITLQLEGGGELTLPRERIRSIRPVVPDPSPPAPVEPETDPGSAHLGGAAAGPTAPGARTLFDRIARLALKYGLETQLVAAVALVESGFDPGAVSSKGALGLMQLMPATAADYGVTDPHDPGQNLEAGIAHLKRLLDRYQGDLPLALAAYNAGEGTVARYGGVPPYPETIRYIDRVLALARVD